jgi:GNAT superfamily N-acetyltransferase
MTLTHRRYRLLADFEKVHRFLTDTYNMETLNSHLLPQFFEYAHTHSYFDHQRTHRFGLWEVDDTLMGVACYEMNVGTALLSTRQGFGELLPEMLSYAETELSEVKDGRRSLSVWITDKEPEKRALLDQHGYQLVFTEPVKIFTYDQPFLEVKLPPGFSVISLEDENDFKKINDCLWKGFDHGDTPDEDLDGRMLMQSAPRFRKDLTTVIKAPNGEYACFAGMWLDETNKYAYLEPLATVPEYRRLGLATVCLTEAMKKTKKLGARYCFGGAREFYTAIGFKEICNRELWKKEWQTL